jgi:type VI secretion system secreted protein VgrG
MAYVQTGRLISITTPLGRDVLLLEGFSGQESISGLFNFTLYLLSESHNISFGAVVGKPAAIQLSDGNGGERYIHGIISQFSQGYVEGRFARYHAVLVPWLWNLTRAADCRIFQNKSVLDIIQEVFRERGFSDFRIALSRAYQPRGYCVQYHETDFDFVLRLMEEEGIFYFFEHASDKHTLVLSDSPSAHQSCPGQSSVPFSPHGGPQGQDSISGWLREQEVRPAKYALTDYNFETPTTSLAVNVPTLVTEGRNDKLEIYDYPGEYQNKGEGERYVKLRMEEQETLHTKISGASDCRSFIPGFTFNLTDHYRSDYNGSYLLTSVSHQAASNLRTGGGDASYSNSFTCIPSKVPYRPARVTPKPIMRGLQTAVVVGPDGEEIYTDKYGRVKVQFHWDRKGKKDEKSSCWIRVSHPWAGKNWGSVSIPRIGQEVIVDFLEGDPDQPIITGRVYNADQMPPYGLPAGGVVSGIKSNSTKGGGGYNEMSMDDTKGKEKITIHAQYDMNTTVEHDDSQTIHNNRTIAVDGTHTETIKKDTKITIESGTFNHDVAGNTATYHVSGDVTENLDSKHAVTVGSDHTLNVKGQLSSDVSGPASYTSQQKITLMVGASTIEMTPSGITLSCGASTIKIDPANVSVTAPKISLNG